jgi:hypothetical protein
MELRQLQQAWPKDAGVGGPLAKILFLTLIEAKEENDLQRRDALLVEMRQLQQAWPQEAAVRQLLAQGLSTRSFTPNRKMTCSAVMRSWWNYANSGMPG